MVIGPVLEALSIQSRDLEQLLVETAFFESTLCGLWSNESQDRPYGIGMWGITQAEHFELDRWIDIKQSWSRVRGLLVPQPRWIHMGWNLAYSCLCATALWYMRTTVEERWPSTWQARHELWERVWMEQPGFAHPDAWKKRLRMLTAAEIPVADRPQRRHKAPRVQDIPGRWAPPVTFSL